MRFLGKASGQSWWVGKLRAVDLIIPSLDSPSETFFCFPGPPSLFQISLFQRNFCLACTAATGTFVWGTGCVCLTSSWTLDDPVPCPGKLHLPPLFFMLPSIQAFGGTPPLLTLVLVFWFPLANETHIQRLNKLLGTSASYFVPPFLSCENAWASFWRRWLVEKRGVCQGFSQPPGWPVPDCRHRSESPTNS